jgi:predicted PurR-regulated permease PerM
MDQQIDELKELVRQNILLTQDTNKIVHKMRRGAAWGRVMTLVMWFVFFVLPIVVSYYYFQPQITKIEQIYTQLQQDNKQAQSYQSQLSNFFGNILPKAATTTSQ